MTDEKLRECPFCGSTDIREQKYNYRLHCVDCGAVGPSGRSIRHSKLPWKARATAAWNRRATTNSPYESMYGILKTEYAKVANELTQAEQRIAELEYIIAADDDLIGGGGVK